MFMTDYAFTIIGSYVFFIMLGIRRAENCNNRKDTCFV